MISMPALHSEWRKATTGAVLRSCLLGAVFMSAITAYGYLTEGQTALGALADGSVTGDMVRAWMLTLLFSALAGSLLVTRETSSGSLGRSVLLLGNRRTAGVSKLLVTSSVGLIFAIVAMVGGVASAVIGFRLSGDDMVWTSETTSTLIGVGLSIVLATWWGHAIGWIVRGQTLAVLVIVVLVLGVEPAVQVIAPAASQFLFTIAQRA